MYAKAAFCLREWGGGGGEKERGQSETERQSRGREGGLRGKWRERGRGGD